MSTAITTPPRRARLVTVVWGVTLLVSAGLLLLGQVIAVSIDPVIAALGLLVGVGLALVAGGVLSLRGRGATTEDPTGGDDLGDDWRSTYGSDRDPTAY